MTLEESQQYAEELRAKMDTPAKNEVRKWLFDNIVKPGIESEGDSEKPREIYSILDFWGGGLFSDYVLDHWLSVQNHTGDVQLIEIDSDPNLKLALEEYQRQCNGVNNHCVIAFSGTLRRFIKDHIIHVQNHSYPVQFCSVKNQGTADQNLKSPVKNQPADVARQSGQAYHYLYVKNQENLVNFAWLDYCGTANLDSMEPYLEGLKTIMARDSSLALTFLRGRDNLINERGRRTLIDTIIKKYFPLHKRVKTFNYHEEGGAMATYVYKPNKKALSIFS